MKPRLTLISAPVSIAERYGPFVGAANTEPSFGLVCLAAVALVAGADVCIVEASAENLSVEQALDRVLEQRPDIVGITATTVGIAAAAQLAEQLKRHEAPPRILVGGCHVTALPEETLDQFPAFDMVVVGEGEETLRELVEGFAVHGVLPDAVPGTVVRTDTGLRRNPPRPPLANLDELPLPAWALLPGFPHKFRPSPMRVRRWPCASVVLTRGCPNQCTFCDRSVFGNQCRAYSPAYAIRLIKDLRENFGVKEILVEDDTFVISRQRVREFCEQVLNDGLDITWSCLGRADRVTPDLLQLMRRAGCWHISYGIETGDPDILRSVNKKVGLEQMRQAVCWSKEAGMRTKGFFMLGFPGESATSLDRTLRLALALPLDDISVMHLTPFPGSELYGTVQRFGEFDRDWRRMNTLDPVFVPAGLSRQQLESFHAKLLRQFFLRPRIIAGYAARLLRHPRMLTGYWRGFTAFLRSAVLRH